MADEIKPVAWMAQYKGTLSAPYVYVTTYRSQAVENDETGEPIALYAKSQLDAAVSKERERCAKLCDDAGGEIDPRDPDEALMMANSLAAAIRNEPDHG